MHISYEFRNETRMVDDRAVVAEIKKNEDAVRVLEANIKQAQDYQDMLRREREQIQSARALFHVYLSENAVGTSWGNWGYRDATIRYLDDHMTITSRRNSEKAVPRKQLN